MAKKLTIGITVNIKNGDNIWNNGIFQNAINFAKLLQNSNNDYTVLLLNTSDIMQLEINIASVMDINDAIHDLDLLFILGSQITDNHYSILKKRNVKIIHYCCGSNYMLDAQDVLFREPNTAKRFYHHTPDEVWIIPQNYRTNAGYFETLYRVKSVKVPFIWSSIFVDYAIKQQSLVGNYKPSSKAKNVACFEPNIDIVKYAMIDILIVESAYRKKPALINHFYVTNSDSIKLNKLFVSQMCQLDIVKNSVATFESRFEMPYFLSNYTDIVVAHQHENPLNYAYLDALYLNYPLVHNATAIKDAGYYYNGFDVKRGAKQLLYALEHHDDHTEEYNQASHITLNRYLDTNLASIEYYDKLIDNILN